MKMKYKSIVSKTKVSYSTPSYFIQQRDGDLSKATVSTAPPQSHFLTIEKENGMPDIKWTSREATPECCSLLEREAKLQKSLSSFSL